MNGSARADDLNRWLLALATPVSFNPGRDLYRTAWKAKEHGASTMAALVALGSSAAQVHNVA